jgi:hypothetical protein
VCLPESMETTRLTYIGPAPHAGELAQEFAAHGLSANYDSPLERKDLATALAAVSVVFAVTGPIRDVIAAVTAFKARHNSVRIEGLPDTPRPSVEERLGRLERLRADGVLNGEEYRVQRDRILGEL